MSWAERQEQFRERVRDANNLQEVAEELGIEVNGSGLAVCVFHNDHDPSMSLSRPWGGKCFGCHKTFDVFTLVQQVKGFTFLEALNFLAKRAGIESLTGDDDDEEYQAELRKMSERKRVEDILTDAAAFMHKNLPTRYRRTIRETYGLDDETIDRAQVGWADSEALRMFLVDGLGYTPDDLLSTGLFMDFTGSLGGFFDDRIVIPYFAHSRAVYMIGRRTRDTSDAPHEQAKYKKLLTRSDKHPKVSETIENSWMFGEDFLTRYSSKDHALITEGVFDCLALQMLGYPTISPVTVQARKKDTPRLVALTRRIHRVTIINDSDSNDSGAKGAIAMGEALHRAGRHVYIATIPRPEGLESIDVCDLCAAERAAAIERNEDPIESTRAKMDTILADAKPYIEFLADRISTDLSAGELSDELRPLFELTALCPPVERDTYTRKISKRFSLARSTVRDGIAEFISTEDRRDLQDQQDEDERNAEAAAKFSTDDRVRGRVFEESDHYYIEGRFADEKISSFLLIGKELVRTPHETLIHAAVRVRGFEHDLRHTFPPRSWISKREFLREMMSVHPACQFTGGDDHVQGVLQCLGTDQLPTMQGVTAVGLVKTADGLRWVTPSVVFDKDGVVDDEDNNLVFVESGSPIQRRLRYGEGDADSIKHVAQRVLPRLLRLNEARVVLPLLGFTMASMLKPLFFDALGHFPILFVHGTQGSGKTSIIRDVFWRMVGVGSDPFSCTDTEFAKARTIDGSTSVLIFYDEYKEDMGRHRKLGWLRMLRRAYNGESETRGRSDQGINEYKLQAPLIVAGETRPDEDPALTERIISVNPDKTALNSERKKVFREITSSKLDVLATGLVLFSLNVDFKDLLTRAKDATDSLLEATGYSVPMRCYDSLQVMNAGLLMFEQWAEELAIELPEVDYLAAFRAVIDELLEGGDGQVKDSFDGFLEACSTYAHLGILREGTHYSLEGNRLHMHLASCHKVYLDERRKGGSEDGTNGLRALRKIAREKEGHGYIVSCGERVELGSARMRCVIIDQSKVPDGLDFDKFPENESMRSRVRNWSSWNNDDSEASN